jgi:hypothetical protein
MPCGPFAERAILRLPRLLLISLSLLWSVPVRAQIPAEHIPPIYAGPVQLVLKKADFTFETKTQPVQVRLETMEKLFDHPRLAAAMWRYCHFSPSFYAVEMPGKNIDLDDAKGLHGILYLVHQQPGERIYYIEGRVERGRMNNPFAVGAKMVVIYRYWHDAEGFHSHLRTWTTLDSAILSFITRPFRRYIRSRQEEFIAYINSNIAQGGQFAQLNPSEFYGPIKQEGDAIAIKEFEEIFERK